MAVTPRWWLNGFRYLSSTFVACTFLTGLYRNISHNSIFMIITVSVNKKTRKSRDKIVLIADIELL